MKSIFVLALAIFTSSSLALTAPSKPIKASFKKVVYMVMENTNYDEALQQPYFAQLAKQGALFTNFLAEGHPSQPNYIAMIAGDSLGVKSDTQVNLSGNSLIDLLESNGKSWKVYGEDYPGNCFLGMTSGFYARKHVPVLSFKNIQSNPTRCAKVVNSSEFDQDVSSNSLPDFSLYIPNLQNDGHNTGAAFADQWLSRTFGNKLSDPSFTKDLLFVLTFDESELQTSVNQVFTVFVGSGVIPGSVVSTSASHHSILKTIEDAFGLGDLGRNDTKTLSVDGIWQ